MYTNTHTHTQSNPVITTTVYATPVYTVIYSVIPTNSSLLTITLHSSVITTFLYNDTKYPFHDVIPQFDFACRS
jgi:hypothetical protein